MQGDRTPTVCNYFYKARIIKNNLKIITMNLRLSHFTFKENAVLDEKQKLFQPFEGRIHAAHEASGGLFSMASPTRTDLICHRGGISGRCVSARFYLFNFFWKT